MPKTAAKGKRKFTICTTKPADIFAPTAGELNAGIDASCAMLDATTRFRMLESETVSEPAVCDETTSEALGASKAEFYAEVWRYFDGGSGGIDPDRDKVFQALKERGSTVWIYLRNTSKKSSEPWAAGDEIAIGGEILMDAPQGQEGSDGFIKYGHKGLPQGVRPFLTVAA